MGKNNKNSKSTKKNSSNTAGKKKSAKRATRKVAVDPKEKLTSLFKNLQKGLTKLKPLGEIANEQFKVAVKQAGKVSKIAKKKIDAQVDNLKKVDVKKNIDKLTHSGEELISKVKKSKSFQEVSKTSSKLSKVAADKLSQNFKNIADNLYHKASSKKSAPKKAGKKAAPKSTKTTASKTKKTKRSKP